MIHLNQRNKNTFVRVGDVIDRVMASLKTDADDRMARIWSLWPNAVGGHIAANTRPTAYKGRTLFVNVESSPWMQELRFLKADILLKINDALSSDAIQEIKFRVGPI